MKGSCGSKGEQTVDRNKMTPFHNHVDRFFHTVFGFTVSVSVADTDDPENIATLGVLKEALTVTHTETGIEMEIWRVSEHVDAGHVVFDRWVDSYRFAIVHEDVEADMLANTFPAPNRYNLGISLSNAAETLIKAIAWKVSDKLSFEMYAEEIR